MHSECAASNLFFGLILLIPLLFLLFGIFQLAKQEWNEFKLKKERKRREKNMAYPTITTSYKHLWQLEPGVSYAAIVNGREQMNKFKIIDTQLHRWTGTNKDGEYTTDDVNVPVNALFREHKRPSEEDHDDIDDVFYLHEFKEGLVYEDRKDETRYTRSNGTLYYVSGRTKTSVVPTTKLVGVDEIFTCIGKLKV